MPPGILQFYCQIRIPRPFLWLIHRVLSPPKFSFDHAAECLVALKLALSWLRNSRFGARFAKQKQIVTAKSIKIDISSIKNMYLR